ncbi:MAG: hypothetical protein OXF23_04980 [Candidatus Dadabacteria bacterium]|nr:hypothetical protein [Candidatus Dadabacteria bacterium]
MQNDEKFFDVRVYKRYIQEGHIAEKDYEKHVKSLPDVSEKTAFLVIDDEEVAEQEE